MTSSNSSDLLNFSTVIVLLNTDVALQLLSVVVNNSKNWHCLQSGKMKAENTPSASSSYLVKKIERTTLICGHFSSINTFVSSIIIGGGGPPSAPPLATELLLGSECVKSVGHIWWVGECLRLGLSLLCE